MVRRAAEDIAERRGGSSNSIKAIDHAILARKDGSSEKGRRDAEESDCRKGECPNYRNEPAHAKLLISCKVHSVMVGSAADEIA